MTFTELNKQPSGREVKAYFQFAELIEELKKRELPDEVMVLIYLQIERINSATGKELTRELMKSKARVIKELEKRLKIVPISYYRNLWTATGLAAFGVPIAVVIGFASGSMAYMGFGLPIGLVIGMFLGISLDKKAKNEGRQLDVHVG